MNKEDAIKAIESSSDTINKDRVLNMKSVIKNYHDSEYAYPDDETPLIRVMHSSMSTFLKNMTYSFEENDEYEDGYIFATTFRAVRKFPTAPIIERILLERGILANVYISEDDSIGPKSMSNRMDIFVKSERTSATERVRFVMKRVLGNFRANAIGSLLCFAVAGYRGDELNEFITERLSYEHIIAHIESRYDSEADITFYEIEVLLD